MFNFCWTGVPILQLSIKIYGITHLFSSSKGYTDVVKLLLHYYEANTIRKDDDGRAVLFHATRHGHYMLVQFYFTKFLSELHTKDHYDVTPLFGALRNGHNKVIEFLLGMLLALTLGMLFVGH